MSRPPALSYHWVTWLPIADFVLNNHVNQSTSVTPFYAVYRRHPCFAIDKAMLLPAVMPARDKLTVAKADEFADVMAHLYAEL